MERIESTDRPEWVSNDMYPFESKFFADRMHFVDEGAGEPIAQPA